MPISLSDLFSNAFTRGCESTISEMAGLFGMEAGEHPFEVCLAVEARLAEVGLVMVPALPRGSLDTARLVMGPSKAVPVEEMLAEVALGEGATIEFKGSLLFDIARAKHQPTAPLSELRSESVIHGCLKTVAAFLNTSGGCLFVGVDDLGKICGIDIDIQFFKKNDVDEWELCLRQLIQGRFHEGITVNDFVRVSFIRSDGHCIARIEVVARKRISFLKHAKVEKAFEVYVRQGNQSVSLNHVEFEQLLDSRRLVG